MQRQGVQVSKSTRNYLLIVGLASEDGSMDDYDLADFAQSNIEQVLARVPGVYSRAEDGYGLRPNIGLRGANSDRSSKVVLMEDGVPLAPAPYAAPAAYYFPMTQRMVGIEVYKGRGTLNVTSYDVTVGP